MEYNQESNSNQTRPYILRFLVENYEENLNRAANQESATNTTPRPDRNQLINYLMLRERNSSESTEELSVLERRIRRRRFTLLDEEGESHDELENYDIEDEYLDFRTYPLTINWKDVYSTENDLFEILENHGYIGAYIYNEIFYNLKDFKTKPESFLMNLINFYHKNYEDADCEGLKNVKAISDIIIKKIDTLYDIIHAANVIKKELSVIKIIFDILIHNFLFLEKFNGGLFHEKIIPYAIFFYSTLTNKDIKYMNNILDKNKITKEILGKIRSLINLDKKLNAILTNKKLEYIQHLVKIKNEYNLLFKGTEESKFVI